MNRSIILFLLMLIYSLSARSEDFRIDFPFLQYFEDYDIWIERSYSLTFRTLDDIPGAVEISDYHHPTDGNGYFVKRIEIPSSISFGESEYSVVSIDVTFPGVEEIYLPSSIRFIKQKIADNDLKELIIDNAPIESIPSNFVVDCDKLERLSFGNAYKFNTIWGLSGCMSLTEIEIPESVTTIGNSAFGFCGSLSKITFGSSITKIDCWAFQGCSALKEIRIPESVSEIGLAAFTECSGLESVTMPVIANIDNGTFKGCNSLKTVNIKSTDNPEIKLIIQPNAFENCCSLTEFICEPENLSTIYDDAFLNCFSLSEFTLDSNTEINGNPFSGCSSLKQIDVKNSDEHTNLYSVDGVLYGRMYGNALLVYPSGKEDKEYTIPSEVYTISKGAFKGNNNIQKVIVGNDISNIEDEAFMECKNLSEIDLKDNLWNIGERAFADAVNLKEVYFGSNLEHIGREAFKGAKALKKAEGGENLKTIGDGAFEGAESLAEISMGNKVEEFGVMVFRDCKALTQVEIPETLGHLPSGTFSGCTSLEKVELPASINYVGKSVFSDCSSLKEAPMPKDLKVIGEGAFSGCSSITSVSIPEGVSELRPNSFKGCSSLTQVKLPDNLISIQRAAFQECESLGNIEIPAQVKEIEERSFKNCNSLESVVIPDAVTTLGMAAFEECASLKSISTGNGMTEIGAWAFSECTNLETVTLGSSLETIGEQAFEGDINITKITCLSEEPPVYSTGFPAEVMENAEVIVPEGSEDTYNSDFTWAQMVEGTDNLPEETTLVSSIHFNETSVALIVGWSHSLAVTVYPEDATDSSLTWSSSDESVASVGEDGWISAVAVGTAVITASACDGSGVKAECTVNVVTQDTNGLDDIFTDEGVVADVYRPDGTLITKGSSRESLLNLPSGLYIIRTCYSVFKINIP